jgi:hypothetical protein
MLILLCISILIQESKTNCLKILYILKHEYEPFCSIFATLFLEDKFHDIVYCG